MSKRVLKEEDRKYKPEKIKEHFHNRAAYKRYCKKYPNVKITAKQFYDIVLEANQEIVRRMIENNFSFHLPGKLGYLEIVKKKARIRLTKDGKLDTKSLSIDWKETDKLAAQGVLASNGKRKLVYHLNDHTEGYVFIFYWFRERTILKNKLVYRFTSCRAANRAIATAINNNKLIDCYELDSKRGRRISRSLTENLKQCQN